MKFNDDVFEAAATITAAVAEEADVELSESGANKAADFFAVLYGRLCLIAEGKDQKSPNPGKFEVFKDARDEFRFRLKAANGETIAASEGYSTKEACLKGIKSVMKSTLGAEVTEE